MDSVIVVFPGTNREKDMADALARISGHTPRYVWHKDTDIGNPDLIVVPGGFSYGDYLRCGAMAAHAPIMPALKAKAHAGTPVLGICNGFQILTEAGLLPGALIRNNTLKFMCKYVTITLEAQSPVFTRNMATGHSMTVPIAHGEGNYVIDQAGLAALEQQGQIAFRYTTPVNGAVSNIAGVYNERKNILGMMPHPENATDPLMGATDGTPLFTSIVSAIMGRA